MTAADTVGAATSPWPAAAGNWTKRRDDDEVLQVWRLIANAGPKGIAKAELRPRLNDIDDAVLTQHLQELRRKGHARFVGDNGSTRNGAWVATPIPWPDEKLPAWIAGLAEDERDELAPPPGAAEATLKAARSVPCSVFAMGEAVAQQIGQALGASPDQALGVDIDAVHMPAEHRQALAEAATVTAPAPAPADTAPIEGAATVTQLPASAAFSLTSDNWLIYRTKLGRVVTIPPDDTRVLFGYLDRLAVIGQTERLSAAV